MAGPNFVDATGRPVFLRGAATCCWLPGPAPGVDEYPERNGWPLHSTGSLLELVAAGANWITLRLGPHATNGPDGNYYPTKLLFSESNRLIALALAHSVQVEVSDCGSDMWGVQHGVNYLGLAFGNIRSPMRADNRQWAERCGRELGGNPNVQFLVSNESFKASGRPRTDLKGWELETKRILNRVAPGRMVGTNSQDPDIAQHFDFVALHVGDPRDNRVPEPWLNKPTEVNEWDTGAVVATADGVLVFDYAAPFANDVHKRTADTERSIVSPKEWARRTCVGERGERDPDGVRHGGTGLMYHLWRGSMDAAQWTEALSYMRDPCSAPAP